MIECTNFKSYEKGTLIGFADFWMEKMGIEIRGCTVHRKGSQIWVNLPSKEFQTPQGETKWAPIMQFRNDAFKRAWSDEAKAAYQDYISHSGVEKEQTEQDDGIPF